MFLFIVVLYSNCIVSLSSLIIGFISVFSSGLITVIMSSINVFLVYDLSCIVLFYAPVIQGTLYIYYGNYHTIIVSFSAIISV